MRYPIHTVGKQKESAIVSTEKVSISHEDYLEAIVMLGGTPEHPVRSVDVATKLGVSKASVSKAISSLKAQGLLDQPFYGDITLTPEGYEYGSAVLKRHEMLTKFLVIKVGIAMRSEYSGCSIPASDRSTIGASFQSVSRR